MKRSHGRSGNPVGAASSSTVPGAPFTIVTTAGGTANDTSGSSDSPGTKVFAASPAANSPAEVDTLSPIRVSKSPQQSLLPAGSNPFDAPHLPVYSYPPHAKNSAPPVGGKSGRTGAAGTAPRQSHSVVDTSLRRGKALSPAPQGSSPAAQQLNVLYQNHFHAQQNNDTAAAAEYQRQISAAIAAQQQAVAAIAAAEHEVSRTRSEAAD